jgi:hypothetical protein
MLQESAEALRVHAMVVRRVPNMAGSPYDGLLLKRSLEGDLFAAMRAATIEWLAQTLGGDSLAAELLLLQLVSRYARKLTITVALCNIEELGHALMKKALTFLESSYVHR